MDVTLITKVQTKQTVKKKNGMSLSNGRPINRNGNAPSTEKDECQF